MKILLAAKYVPTGPRPIGGVQTWIATARRQLELMGHVVEEWQPGRAEPEDKFDLGILANMQLTGHLADMCDRVTCVSHGIIKPERPGNATRTMFVSEGVREHWNGEGSIIRQPINLDFWRQTGGKRSGVVRYSYRKSHTMCAEAAKALGQTYRHVTDATPAQARDILGSAALVFASGRAALEAMACGAPTVIYDHRSAYQGEMLGLCLGEEMKHSYSGRSGVKNPTLNQILSVASRAVSRRDWVEQHHDARKIVQELVA